jgi:AraC-like DNA-binding protein
MSVDLNLINHVPVANRIVERHFREFPVYLRKESIRAHRYKLHVQPGIEFNLSLTGTATYVIGERIYRTAPGQLLVFPGCVPHQVFVDDNAAYRRAVICVDDATLLQGAAPYPGLPSALHWFDNDCCRQFQLQMNKFSVIKQIALLMHKERQEQKKGWQHMLLAQLLSLTVIVERMVEEQADACTRAAPRYATRELADRCCSYIEAHLYEDLSLNNVAPLFHVSPEHLTRTFKREKGVAFYQYVLLQRIQESKRLLLTGDDTSLTDIAYALGFASSSHFSRTFRSVTNQTPSEFRLRSHSGVPSLSQRADGLGSLSNQ